MKSLLIIIFLAGSVSMANGSSQLNDLPQLPASGGSQAPIQAPVNMPTTMPNNPNFLFPNSPDANQKLEIFLQKNYQQPNQQNTLFDGGMSDGGGCLIQSADHDLQFLDFAIEHHLADRWVQKADAIPVTKPMQQLGLGLVNLKNLPSYQKAQEVLRQWTNAGDSLTSILLDTSSHFEQAVAMKDHIILGGHELCTVDSSRLAAGDRPWLIALYSKTWGLTISAPMFNQLSFTQQVGFWLHEILRNVQIQSNDQTPNATLLAVTDTLVWGQPQKDKPLYQIYEFGTVIKDMLSIRDYVQSLWNHTCAFMSSHRKEQPAFAAASQHLCTLTYRNISLRDLSMYSSFGKDYKFAYDIAKTATTEFLSGSHTTYSTREQWLNFFNDTSFAVEQMTQMDLFSGALSMGNVSFSLSSPYFVALRMFETQGYADNQTITGIQKIWQNIEASGVMMKVN